MIDVKNLTKYFGPVLAVDASASGRPRRDRRLPRPQRRRQDDDHAHPHHLPAGHQRHRRGGRLRRDEPVDGGAPQHRLPARERAALPRDARRGVPATSAPSSRASPQGAASARSTTAWSRCRIREVRRRLIGTLSKGYRQRVGLADAMIHDPPILILDEPTAGLDPVQIRETLALIKELGESHTILLSTHILSEVEAVCGRIIIIHRGRLSVGPEDDRAGRRRADPRSRSTARPTRCSTCCGPPRAWSRCAARPGRRRRHLRGDDARQRPARGHRPAVDAQRLDHPPAGPAHAQPGTAFHGDRQPRRGTARAGKRMIRFIEPRDSICRFSGTMNREVIEYVKQGDHRETRRCPAADALAVAGRDGPRSRRMRRRCCRAGSALRPGPGGARRRVARGSRHWPHELIGPVYRHLLTFVGLGGLLFHAANDSELQIRRAYMGFGLPGWRWE